MTGAAGLAIAGGALALGSTGASAFVPPDPTQLFTGNLQICHATGSDANPYSTPPPANVSGILSGHEDHEDDIIPAVRYLLDGQEVFFAGLNWDAAGQAIYANDCVVPETTTPTTPTTPPTTPTTPPTTPTTQPGSPTTQPGTPTTKPTTASTLPATGPVGTGTTMTVAVLMLLAGSLLMLSVRRS